MGQTGKEQINSNLRYNRRKRAKQCLCTVCGDPVEDKSYMLCKKCREKNADKMRKYRKSKAP